jgi:hypothetical protein
MKDQPITSEDDLECALTDVREKMNIDVLESVFREWMIRLGWVMKRDRKYYVNPQ